MIIIYLIPLPALLNHVLPPAILLHQMDLHPPILPSIILFDIIMSTNGYDTIPKNIIPNKNLFLFNTFKIDFIYTFTSKKFTNI